jgi:hypothetical protein
MIRRRCRVMLTIVPPSHAGDGAAEVTWPWRDVGAKSSWQQCCRVKLVLAVVRSHSPRAQSIEVLPHHEEVEYSCSPRA